MGLEAAKRPINWIGSGLLAKNFLEAIDGFGHQPGAAFFSDSSQISGNLQVPTGFRLLTTRIKPFQFA